MQFNKDTDGPKQAIRRKAISKKARFEVFKRDSFTCQYCGGQSPDVVLHVDHISPVAGGGSNDTMNLITSCQPCNAGKGARTLDDASAIAKQKAQLDELNIRREQLEMMLKWREGLSALDEQQIDAVNHVLATETGCNLSDFGRSQVARWLKRHSVQDLIMGLDAALETYYKNGAEDAGENSKLASKAFDMTVRVLSARARYADKPWMKDLFYTRAIIRNSMYCNERLCLELLESAFAAGIPIEDLKDWAKEARNWTAWRETMEEWIEGASQ